MSGATYQTAADTLPLAMPSTTPPSLGSAQKLAALASATTAPPSSAPDWSTWASSGNTTPPSAMSAGGAVGNASAPSTGGSGATDAGYSGSAAPGATSSPDVAGQAVVRAANADPTKGQGSTGTTTGGGGGTGSLIMNLLGDAGVVAANVYGGPAAGLAASTANSTLEPAIFGKA